MNNKISYMDVSGHSRRTVFIYFLKDYNFFYLLLTVYLRLRRPVVQRITRLTTDQEIPGSNPGSLADNRSL